MDVQFSVRWTCNTEKVGSGQRYSPQSSVQSQLHTASIDEAGLGLRYQYKLKLRGIRYSQASATNTEYHISFHNHHHLHSDDDGDGESKPIEELANHSVGLPLS